MEIIKLNLIPSGVNPTCHCSQYDNGRVIRIDLFDGLTPYVLQSGDTVTLNVRKPDNTIVTTSLTATQGNTYVNLVTAEQICACVGYNLCDLTITNGSVVIGTLNFIMQIERDVLADGIPSQSVIEDLDELVAEAVAQDLGDNYYTKTQTNNLIAPLQTNIEDLKDIVGFLPLNSGQDLTGYYSGAVGDTITYTSQATSHAFYIDLTPYIGKCVHVKFNTSSTVSSRITALCNSSDVIGDLISERDMTKEGYYFYPDSTYYKLYVSYSSAGNNLSIDVLSGISESLKDINDIIGLGVVYVDSSVATSGDGSLSSPFKTIQEAINANGKTIKVKSGDYSPFSIIGKSDIKIMLWDMPNYDVSNPDVPKIKITNSPSNGLNVENSNNVLLSDIHVKNARFFCFNIRRSDNIEVVRCYAEGNTTASYPNFYFENVNAVVRDCVSWDSQLDGFNIHGYGNTEFINCVAYDCADDGISHHDGCTGLILGGEYYGNGKGGVSSPYGGAIVDVQNVYIHNNTKYGIYSMSSTTMPRSKGRISNCVIKNNALSDIIADYTDLIGWNNIYDTKSIGSNATFTEF